MAQRPCRELVCGMRMAPAGMASPRLWGWGVLRRRRASGWADQVPVAGSGHWLMQEPERWLESEIVCTPQPMLLLKEPRGTVLDLM